MEHEHLEDHKYPKKGLGRYFGWVSIKSKKRFFLLILVFIFSLFFLIAYRKPVVLVILLIIVMAWDAFQHYIHIPIHLDFLPFVSLFVTSEYGLAISSPFMLIGGIVPEIIVGHFEVADSLSILPILILNVIFSPMLSKSFTPIAYIAALIFALIEVVIAFIAAEPPSKRFLEPFAVFTLSAIFIWRISPLLFFLVH